MLNSPYEQESYLEIIPKSLSMDKWQKTVNLIIKLFNAPGAWIMQANTKGIEGIIASTEKKNKAPAGSVYSSSENIFCKTVMETKKHLYVKNATREGGWEDNPVHTESGFNSYLGVPLQWPNGNIFGTLCVLDDKETDYSADFVELMWQLKEVIDSDLHNMVLIEKLQQQSTTDELTGISNRRGFMKAASSLVSQAKRNKLSLSLMYFDLNNLKAVNDTYGHKAGDFLITSFASAISNSVRNEDIVARLGGDEFCFMGIYKSDDRDKLIESRIQQTLEVLTSRDNRVRKPSFSIGCKVFKSEENFDLDKMLSDVDSLMYENKRKTKGLH